MNYQLGCDFRAFKTGEYISDKEFGKFPEHVQRQCKKVEPKPAVKPTTTTSKKPIFPSGLEPDFKKIDVTFDLTKDLQ